MIVTTTPSIEGRRTMQDCGIVTGEAILGAHLFKDIFASERDLDYEVLDSGNGGLMAMASGTAVVIS